MLEVLIAHSLPDLIGNLVMILGVIIMIFSINPLLAALTMIPVPFVLISGMIFSKKVAPLFKINQEVLGELGGSTQDYLSGMKEIQAFCAEDSQRERMKKMCKEYSYVNIRANFANGIFHPSVEFLTSMGTVIVVGAGGALALRGMLDVSDVVGFFMYLGLFYSPLTVLTRLFEDVNSAFAGASRVFDILDTDSDIKDADNASSMGKAKGSVEFENVSFSYKEGTTVLSDISFKVNPGEMYAFVGPTGVGKTTVVSLIERFYDPTTGRIFIDGKDIRDVTVKSLRENISLVLQDVFLFNGTIAENIAFGAKNASRDEIEKAARIARAEEFILGTENGYDTIVGERGMKLSGGQKQRIAIARAVLRDTPILILDEATSAVDTETEADIREAIDALAGTRTIFVIAHRLSTVKKADKILVFENSVIAESGTHHELMNTDGIYSKMANI
ncbi:atp-binding cassette sub-family b [Holotrichia oblita]|nr:atp-binding cassette sub-family b [Holotrichia oblita]